MPRGTLIGGLGLPGSGKSSLFKELGRLLASTTHLEPEESDWPSFIHDREHVGYITALQWFRSKRVPMLYEARRQADQGLTALIDSLYDKLCFDYLGDSGMEWLLPRNDPYFENFRETARLDRKLLPDVDVVVMVTVTKADYAQMIATRCRTFDQSNLLLSSFEAQGAFVKAAQRYHDDTGVPLIMFPNDFGSVSDSAENLLDTLRRESVLA